MTDGSGATIPVQAHALDRWPDGSVSWAALDFQASCDAGAVAPYVVGVSPATRPSPDSGIAVSEHDDRVLIDTGTARFSLSRAGSFPFDRIEVPSGGPVDCARTSFRVEDDRRVVRTPVITEISVEADGPIRACVRVEAVVGFRRRESLQLSARLHFFVGSSTVKFVVTLRNPRAARHPGGIWELGSRGSVYLRDVSLILGLTGSAGAHEIRCSPETGLGFTTATARLELYQDSSGGEHWQSSNHVNRFGKVPNSFRGYRLRADEAETSGLRASPVVSVTWGRHEVAVGMQHFWPNFPKAIEATADAIVLRLFPKQYADLHELQGGEQKTHTFHVAFDSDHVTERSLEWCRTPLFARSTPRWYCDSGAVPYLVPSADDPYDEYRQLVNAAIEGESAFVNKREIIDEYGWRNFGDVYADHEAVFLTGPRPLVSHYNNQYDAAAGMACQFLRTGDKRWWNLFRELTSHVADIDIYHTDRDKSAYNSGLFWHTHHYVDAGKSTHRSYPHSPGVFGGGPSNEHDYSTGLMLRYLLTGEAQFREAAIGLARWVLNMDDGRKTVFRWLASGDTGHASATGTPLYHGPGRGAAYSIITLLNAHQLTGECEYLTKAEQLVRRCIHPRDDIEARNLLDAERRWYYTVFLQALGRYLDHKADRQQLDFMYAYARESLLQYARWMLPHEYPYLDKPEILEYPTETWAALDMRKSEVFKFAAKHSEGAERSQFLERSEFFFRYSTRTLSGMKTGTLARPVVLLLSNGYMHSWFHAHPTARAFPPSRADHDFGMPELFVPQKVQARARLARLAVVVAVLVGLLGWIVIWH